MGHQVVHQVVFVRHGESTWNRENRFTGWTDVDLTEKGEQEAQRAGALLRNEGFDFDEVHSSLLKRALRTMNFVLTELDRLWLPVHKSWRLNERHYGALQGLDKKQTSEQYGDAQVFAWRRSYSVPPPALEANDPRHPAFDARYAALPPRVVPATECLADVVQRVVPYWEDHLAPAIRAGKRVLVVAHGNSLRALVKYLDGVSDEAITDLNIPTGIPLVYGLDSRLEPQWSRYLGDPEEARRAAEAVAKQASRIA
jgi:2,3-bisphosphoglycerate-dependent phosphoglycerate mutase